MQQVLSSYAYFYLNQIFSLPERYAIYSEFEKVFEKNLTMKDCSYMEFNKFFNTEAKLKRFKNYYIEPGTNLKAFKTNVLGGTMHRPEETLRGVQHLQPLFSEGVEVYKGAANSVHEVAVNYCSADLMALATAKGSREVSVRSSLQTRKRTVDGLKLIDEEPSDWAREITRFNKVQSEYNERLYPSFVVGCVGKLLGEMEGREEFGYLEPVEAKEWCQRDCSEFCCVK